MTLSKKWKTNKDDLIDGKFGANLWITVKLLLMTVGLSLGVGGFGYWMEVNVLDQKPIHLANSRGSWLYSPTFPSGNQVSQRGIFVCLRIFLYIIFLF